MNEETQVEQATVDHTEKLADLDAVVNALGSNPDVHSSSSTRIAFAKRGHAIINSIRAALGHKPVIASLDVPLVQIPTAKVSVAPVGGLEAEPHADSPAAVKSAEMLAAMEEPPVAPV